jgi:hypothetical protein
MATERATMNTARPVVAILAIASPALAQYASSGTLPEGTSRAQIVDGGLTFHGLDMRNPGQNPPYLVAMDGATGSLQSVPRFTSPNNMGFGGYTPGEGCAFGRNGSLRILLGAPVTSASIDVFEHLTGAGNTIGFTEFSAGPELARMSTPVLPCCDLHHQWLFLNGGPFDESRLFGEGAQDAGAFLRAIDTVLASTVQCYANCDGSTTAPFLNVLDFNCYLIAFARGESYANCDIYGGPPVLNVLDFNCFMNRFWAGCSSP